MFWNKYPYTNFHELNLDWIIQKIRELDNEIDEFTALNKITYGGVWDITKQYPAWAIVSNSNGSQTYVSIKPVPAGVALTDSDYWEEILHYNNKRKYVFVSDSYGLTVIPALVSYLGLDASEYVNIQRNGSFFGAPYGDPLNFQTMIEETTTTDDDTYTDVVYIGGCNETVATKADITANAAQCYDYVAGRFINAKQWYMMAGYFGGITGDTYNIDFRVNQNQRMPECINATERPFIYNEVWYPLADTDNMRSSDWEHPTSDGGKKVAFEICQCLLGGHPDFKTDMYNMVSLTTSHTVNFWYLALYRHNDHVIGNMNAFAVTLSSPVSVGSAGARINIGTISNRFIRGGLKDPTHTWDLHLGSAFCQSTDTNNVMRRLPAEIYLSAANELIIELAPNWNDAGPYNISFMQIAYFNFDICGYMN